MRFSLRTLLFVTTIACATMAWVEYHGIDYRFFWPPWALEAVGTALLVVAHRLVPNVGLPIAIAGLLMIVCTAIAIMHLPLIAISANYGNFPGHAGFIDYIRLQTASAVVPPTIAYLVCARLALQSSESFTRMQQGAMATVCVISFINIVTHVCWLNLYAPGY